MCTEKPRHVVAPAHQARCMVSVSRHPAGMYPKYLVGLLSTALLHAIICMIRAALLDLLFVWPSLSLCPEVDTWSCDKVAVTAGPSQRCQA